MGKSSLLNAIEFGLFGEVEHFRGEEFSITRDELVNAFAPLRGASVELWMTAPDGTRYYIKRLKKIGKRSSTLLFEVNEKEFEGKNAQDKINELTKLSSIDFHSSVYLRQGLLRDIVVGAPRDRAKAIDSLIGIRDINEILESIPVGYAIGHVKNLETMIEKIEAEKIGASKAFEKELEDVNAYLNEMGFFQPIPTDAAIELYKKVTTSLYLLAEKIGLEKERFEEPHPNVEELKKAVIELTDYLRYLLREPGKKSVYIQQRRDEIKNFLRTLGTRIYELKDLGQEEQKLIYSHGERLATAEIGIMMKETTKIRKEIETFNETISLLESALSIMMKSEQNRCPLCKLEFDKTTLIKHIKKELEAVKASQTLRSAQEKITQLEQRIDERRSVIAQFQAIDERFVRIKEAVENNCQELGISDLLPFDNKVFKFDLASFTNQIQMLQERLKNRKIELEKQEEDIRDEKDRVLLKAEEDIDTLRLVISFIEKREQLSNLKSVLPDAFRQKKNLAVRLDEVQLYLRSLKTLCNYLEKSRTKAATEILNALEPQMNQIYARLRPHPVYDRLNLEATRGKGRAGRRLFSYMIKAVSEDREKETFVKTRFSHAQMNIVGLSIFLALVLGAPHKFEAIVLDEPDQSLDFDHKKNLAAILRDIQSYKQIIVTTQDEDFQKILLEQLVPSSGKSRVVYNLYDWEQKHGPRVTHSIEEAPKM